MFYNYKNKRGLYVRDYLMIISLQFQVHTL